MVLLSGGGGLVYAVAVDQNHGALGEVIGLVFHKIQPLTLREVIDFDVHVRFSAWHGIAVSPRYFKHNILHFGNFLKKQLFNVDSLNKQSYPL